LLEDLCTDDEYHYNSKAATWSTWNLLGSLAKVA